MKTKPTEKAGAANLAAITHPSEIIARHLAPAIKPFAADLLASAELDRKYAAEMDATHPDAARKLADELFERAANGDASAEKELRDAGGRDAFINTRTAFFDINRAKHISAAMASAPLWEKVSAAIIGAIDAANVEIKAQWRMVCEVLGEHGELSRWDEYCRNLKVGIERAPFAAQVLKHGTDWQLRSLGLAEIVGLE